MFILSCSWVRLVECRGIESQALKAQILPSRPEEFHLQPLTDSVREPLDSYGSCRPSLQNLSTLELRNKPKLLSFPIDLGSTGRHIPFAPSPLQRLQHYYGMIRLLHRHRYFPPSFITYRVFPWHPVQVSHVP